ncbi:hypothetical protein QAD02_000011 [Eretmocerus hayati]|uniref:Uncharacterized protein n=1 Tax=Eretmocerus hayati TaxID=131215 RepID=A0ACC2NCE4_9HYME|nr:hypothetical protein QAD02_000011 [Eretmocerus hayati]
MASRCKLRLLQKTRKPRPRNNKKSRETRKLQKLNRQRPETKETRRRVPSFWKQFQIGMILHTGQAKHKLKGQVGTAAWEFIHIITGVTERKFLPDAAEHLLKKMEDQEIRGTWEKNVKKVAANFDQRVCWFNHEKNRPSIFGIDYILGDYLDALAVQQL